MLFYGNMLCGTAAFCKPFPKEMVCCKKDGGKIFPLLFGGGQKAFFVRHHPSGYFFSDTKCAGLLPCVNDIRKK